ncbi:MAG: hypothetical protein AAGF99_11795, partial [Bacteroidota bacterium]
MLSRCCLFVALALGTAVPSIAQNAPRNTSGGPLDSRQAAYDVYYYDLDLAIDPAAQAIEGTLT